MIIKRYCDLLLYTVISYLFLLFVGDTSLWKEWSSFCQKIYYTQSSPIFSNVIFVVAGLLINMLATHFHIYHPNRALNPCWRFPPLTFSVGVLVLFWGFQSSHQLVTLMVSSWGLFVGLLILPALHFFLCKFPRFKEASIQPPDSPKSLEELDSEPKHAAELLLEKLENGQHHIALCGAFGTGKTSIIDAVITKRKEDNKNSLIHCNIDLWGITTSSIVEFVLDEITLALSEHMDVSGLKRLPAHYLEAIKTSNSSLSFLSSLLHKHESPDSLLQHLAQLLQITGKKLVVTIQDIDRNEDAKASMSLLAGLLERLKSPRNNITYIFAAENTPEFSETIRRICPVRIDVLKPILKQQVKSLHEELVATLPKGYLKDLSCDRAKLFDAEIAAGILPSFRAFETLEKMVRQVWGNVDDAGKLLYGEVYPHELILMYALKNEYPQVFDLIIHAYTTVTENTLEELLTKYMSQASMAEKDFAITIFSTLGFLNDCEYRDVPGPSNDDIKQRDLDLQRSFESAPDVLSIVNQDRKRLIIQGGFISENSLSHIEAYDLFKAIAQGNLEKTDTLISKVCSDKQDKWLAVLESYGIPILFTSNQCQEVPQKIVHAFLSVPNSELSYKLINSIKPKIEFFANSELTNCIVPYLISDQFSNDIQLWMEHLKVEVLDDIVFIISQVAKFKEGLGVEDVNIHSVIRRIVMGIAKDRSDKSTAILISLSYCRILGNALSDQDIQYIKQQLESVNLESVSLLVAYQGLYPEYDSIRLKELKELKDEYRSALAGLENIAKVEVDR
ncbi:P-loop NTPase fold protein [Paraglaciecola sp.]|uniref:P-loop NTPase fold protein n=1 Tax=Paraglaciecola sp. TaxID=1920173 RepID=UPI0032675EC8